MNNAKRDIFAFTGGQTPTAINMEHVTLISLTEKKVTFNFVSGSGMFVDLEDEEKAKAFYENLVKTWAGVSEMQPPIAPPKCGETPCAQ